MWISEKSLVAVRLSLANLSELIVSPKNLNQAYLQVKRNGGTGGGKASLLYPLSQTGFRKGMVVAGM